MMQDVILQIKYLFSRLSFQPNKDTSQRLQASFGQLKEDTFNFEHIKSYFQKKDNTNAFQVLSDKTCNDLDIDELFMFIDRTHSKVGQQYLYNTLRTVNPDHTRTQLNEDLIAELTNNVELRVAIQKQLETLHHKDAYHIAALFQDQHIAPPKGFNAIKLLAFASLLSLILGFFNPIMFMVLLALFAVNFVIHYANKKNINRYTGSIPQLLKLNRVASFIFSKSVFKPLQPDLPKSIQLVNTVKSRLSFFQLESKLQGEFEIIAWLFFEIVKILFLLEPLLLFGVLKRLDNKRDEIEKVYTFVGHVDMLISVAALRHSLTTYCTPTITTNDALIAKDVSHPLIVNCTTNSINITDKSVLLTGSNMSGKTSFIRAIGLNVITGLTLNTCFATAMTFPLLKVFSAIRITDDVMHDKSYYFEEVLTIKEIIKASEQGHKNLFLLDELFKGTNTVERISAGKSILSALAKNNNIVLVSTHDIELTDMLANEYELFHFSETVTNQTIGFDYKLKAGKLKHRNAIRILEINDYPKAVVQEAIEIAKQLDATY